MNNNFEINFNVKNIQPQLCQLSLNEILGFSNSEYKNNSIYVSENHPNTNVNDQIFLKIFLNDQEVLRCNTTDSLFSYYELFNIDMEYYFGKNFYYKNNINKPFELLQTIDLSEISFEFWSSSNHQIKRSLDFDLVLEFDYYCN